DVVLSTFGVMFAPRHAVAAAELVRVLRPGGRFGLFNWSPEGSVGSFFRAMAGYMPPPPDFAMPPLLWGTEAHVRDLFEGMGVQLEFAREVAPNPSGRFNSGDEEVEHYTRVFGPLKMLRGHMEAQGRWPVLREELARLYEQRANEPGEYLAVVGRKA